jgi:hypothetical protein
VPNVEDYRKVIDSGVLEEVRDEIRRELFESWCLTETVEDRERIFFRQMAVDDLCDLVKFKAKQRLEDI